MILPPPSFPSTLNFVVFLFVFSYLCPCRFSDPPTHHPGQISFPTCAQTSQQSTLPTKISRKGINHYSNILFFSEEFNFMAFPNPRKLQKCKSKLKNIFRNISKNLAREGSLYILLLQCECQ